MLVRMQSNRNSHSLKVGMQNGTDTLIQTLDIQVQKKAISSHRPYIFQKKLTHNGSQTMQNAKLLDDNMFGGQTHKMEKC